jgi:Raf kinase inhibitor-like YbhB/YbcL family protein
MEINQMRIRASLLLAAPVLLLAAGLANAQEGMGQGGGAPRTPPAPLTMTSTAFTDGQTLPTQYTCSAKPAAVNPPLAWTNVPKGTESFTIITHDMEPRARKGIEDNLHWMIWNIPATATSVPEGIPAATAQLPDGALQSQPGAPNPGYRGPCPPMNVSLIHHYVFELFALDQKLDVPAGATRDDVMKAMDGHIIGHAVLVSVFHR